MGIISHPSYSKAPHSWHTTLKPNTIHQKDINKTGFASCAQVNNRKVESPMKLNRINTLVKFSWLNFGIVGQSFLTKNLFFFSLSTNMWSSVSSRQRRKGFRRFLLFFPPEQTIMWVATVYASFLDGSLSIYIVTVVWSIYS